MEPKLYVKILDLVKVLPVRRETTKTEITLTLKLDTEDVLLQAKTSFNAESMVDQTTMTRALWLMLNVLVFHGLHNMSRPAVNSESLLKVGLKEEPEMDNGDH
jgi:hypothetical protein